MTSDDVKSRSIDNHRILHIYETNRILNIINVPVDDSNLQAYERTLIEAAVQLHKMVTLQRLKVFVHCTSGYNRCSAVFIVYLCLFMAHKYWKNCINVAEWLKL